MKNIYIIMLFSAIFGWNANAQSPGWEWARSAGGNDQEEGVSISTDAAGNVLVTGYFKSTVITFDTITLANTGGFTTTSDIFIVKYDALGNLLWAQSAGGPYDDHVKGTFDGNGNILVTGGFKSSITFGTVTLTGSGSNEEMFVVKYDSQGNILWAKSAGEINTEYGFGISADSSGSVLVTGAFTGPSITFGTTTLINFGNGNCFLVKYDSSGNVQWAKSAGANVLESGRAVSTDSIGNVLVAGLFTSPSFNFGIGQTILINSGSDDMFVAKYDSAGNFLWAQSAGGIYNEEVSGLSIAGNGSVVVTGFFSSPSLTVGPTTLINSGVGAVFVAKYDTDGNVIWAKSSDGTVADFSKSIAVDANDNVVVTGNFYSPTITFGTTTLTNGGGINTFIVKYNASGNVLWAKSSDGTQDDGGNAICADVNGSILVTGYFNNADILLGTTLLSNSGSKDIYIAKLDSTGFTGIADENIASHEITIFPNPNNGQFKISSPTSIDEVKITNVTGQLVHQENPNDNNFSWSIDENGIYIISIRTRDAVELKKIVVQLR